MSLRMHYTILSCQWPGNTVSPQNALFSWIFTVSPFQGIRMRGSFARLWFLRHAQVLVPTMNARL